MYQNEVCVKSGTSNNRSFNQDITKGRVTISGTDLRGNKFKRVAYYLDGRIVDNKYIQNGKTEFHIVYGKYERKDNNIIRFKGDGKGKHGKSRTFEKLFGTEGTCHSWYSNGRLVKQKFIYANGKKAYDYKCSSKPFEVKDKFGNLLFAIKGRINGSDCAYYGGHSVLHKNMKSWFMADVPFEVKKNGKVIYAGLYKNRQRQGEWVEEGKKKYYLRGVEVPKNVYFIKPEDIDIRKVLNMDNAQVRMALLDKINPEQFSKVGKVIHSDGDMRLYAIPKLDVKILRVKCTTTGAFYYLKVPHDSTECEQARQWTFGVGREFNKPIKFEVET